MARHGHHGELAKAGECAQHRRERHRLAVAVAAVLRQQGGRWQEVAALPLLVIQRGVRNLLKETEGQGDAGVEYELSLEQKLFLFTRSDTIYAGSNEIQRNIIGERALGLPKEPS